MGSFAVNNLCDLVKKFCWSNFGEYCVCIFAVFTNTIFSIATVGDQLILLQKMHLLCLKH